MSQHIKYAYNLAPHTWFQTGGPADVFVKPRTLDELQDFLIVDKGTFAVLGAGSNTLIRDQGYRGAVIKLGRGFALFEHANDLVTIGAACLNRTAVYTCLEHGLSGLEFLVGIPGTIGGAVAMNAGAHGHETKDYLRFVGIVTREGLSQTLSVADLNMRYRACDLPEGAIVVSATFALSTISKEQIAQHIQANIMYRDAHQPASGRTGGSTFKNPLPHRAWELIDAVGLRGHRIGDAQFSEKHCNFILNLDKATAMDIESLAELARSKVYERFGIDLEWEIERIG